MSECILLKTQPLSEDNLNRDDNLEDNEDAKTEDSEQSKFEIDIDEDGVLISKPGKLGMVPG